MVVTESVGKEEWYMIREYAVLKKARRSRDIRQIQSAIS
jgi:hypothetical protein